MVSRGVWIFAVVLVLSLSFAARGAENGHSFTFNRNAVIVPVWLNGVGPYPFLLDTGIAHPVIARDVAAYLKLDPAADATDTVTAKTLSYGGLSGANAALAVMELVPLRQRFGVAIAGVFSGRELGGAIAIDFQRSLFEASASDDAAARNDKAAQCVALAVSNTDGLSVQALVNGTRLQRFAVDTSFPGAMAAPEKVLREMGCLSEQARRLTALPPSNVPPQIRLKSLRVGGAELIDPICSISGPDAAPKIGLDFLRHFRVVFNFTAGQLTLQPSLPRTPRQPALIGCGLSPQRFDDGLWSLCVATGSSAAREGVKSGDLVLEINGKDMRDRTYQEVLASLEVLQNERLTVTVSSETAAGSANTRTVTLSGEELL